MQLETTYELRLPVTAATRWHYKRSLQGVATEGAVVRRSKLSPRWDGWWRRLRTGHLWVMEVAADGEGGTLVLNCDRNHRLAVIPIPYGEPVCIKFDRVVAMTSDVRLRSCTHLSLPAICLRHIFVSFVECKEPNTTASIIAEIPGEASTLASDAEFDIGRLVAWDAGVRFRISRLPRISDVFLTQPYVKAVGRPSGRKVLLLEQSCGDSQHTVVGTILRLIRLLLPL